MINEGKFILTPIQRTKKAMQMRRLLPRLKRAKELRKRRMADIQHLEIRAERAARNRIRNRIAGLKGRSYNDLSSPEKVRVDKMMMGKEKIIKRIAKRLLPIVRKAEQNRLKNQIHKAIAGNVGSTAGPNDAVKEAVDVFETELLETVFEAAEQIHLATETPLDTLYKLCINIFENDVWADAGSILKEIAHTLNAGTEDFKVIVTEQTVSIVEPLTEVKKENHPEDKHVHVVYSSGEWGNRKWQYRVYHLPKKKEKDIHGHLKQQNHHVNLARNGWHVETAVVAHRKDMDKTQGKLNRQIIKHAESDAKIRNRLSAAEKPKEPKSK